MDNLIDEIVEQVYAQFNEETGPSPEQQEPKSPEQKDDKTKASEIPPELIEKIKNLNAKVEQHKGLYTKVSEFLEMMKDGMLGDASAEDLKSFLAEGEAAKARLHIAKLLKIGKPKHIIEASNIIMKELDRIASKVIPSVVKRIQDNTPEILKHIAGPLKAFEEIYKIASKFPALVKKILQKSSDAPAADSDKSSKMIIKMQEAIKKVNALAEQKKDIFIGSEGYFSRLLSLAFIPKGTGEEEAQQLISKFGGDFEKVKEVLASEAIGAVLEKRSQELYKVQPLQEAEEGQTVVEVYEVKSLKEFNAMFTGKVTPEGGFEEGSGRYFVKSEKEEMVPVAAKEKEQEKEKGEPGEREEPELWDPDPKVIETFLASYNAFRQRFYRVKKLLQQGQLVSALKSSLEQMAGDEEQEAAIERHSDEADPTAEKPPEETPPEEEKLAANESRRPGQISERFLKWLTTSRITDLIVETMDEADEDVVTHQMDMVKARRKSTGMDKVPSGADAKFGVSPDKTTASDEEPPKEGEQIPKKELQNIQADVESFYQNALKMRDGLEEIGQLAKAGSSSFRNYKGKWMEQAEEIQQDIAELYQDLININPPKSALKEAEEQPKEISDMTRAEKSKMLQKVYDTITDRLSPIASALKKKSDISYDRMEEPVSQALKSLNTVLQMFPSVQAFKGGSFDDMLKRYDTMMTDLDVLTKLFQRLIKSGEMSSLTVRNLYKGIMEFSKGLEELFGVKSKIEGKPAPEAAEKPGEEKPEDTDGDKFSDEEEEQAKTDPEDPNDVPSDIDKDGASDAAEDEAGTDKEDPKSKPEEKGEVDINSPASAEVHIKRIMPYSLFQKYLPNANAQQYNAIMLMYLLSKYKEPVKENEEKKGFPKDSLSIATRKFEAFFGFNKDSVNDDLRRLKTLNKPAFDSLLSFFKAATPAEIRKFANIMTQRMEKRPFSVSLSPDKLMKDSTAPEFADSDEIKKAQSVEEPPKDKKQKNPMLDMAPDREALSKIYRERLKKMIEPIVEKMLRGING